MNEKFYKAVSIVACLAAVGCFLEVKAVRSELDHLRSDLTWTRNELDDSIRAIEYSITNAQEQEASLLTDRHYTFGETDLEQIEIIMIYSVVPKEVTEETQAILHVGGKEYPMEMHQGTFTADVSIPIFDETTIEKVVLLDGAKMRTEILNDVLFPYYENILGKSDFYAHFYGKVDFEDSLGIDGLMTNGLTAYDGTINIGSIDIDTNQHAEWAFLLDGKEINRGSLTPETNPAEPDADGYYSSGTPFPFTEVLDMSADGTYELVVDLTDDIGWIHRILVDSHTRVDGELVDDWDMHYTGSEIAVFDANGKLLHSFRTEEEGKEHPAI